MNARKHMARVADLPCCVCGYQPVQVHHLIGRNMRGLAQRSHDVFTIPLCGSHHHDLHQYGWRTWERQHGSQLDHLARTLELLL